MLKSVRVNTWKDVRMGQIQLASLIVHYAQCNRAEGKSPATVIFYSEALGKFVRFLTMQDAGGTVADFTPANARLFVIHEQERGLSPFTVQDRVRALKAFSSWLVREGYLRDNVMLLVKLPKAPVLLVKPLADEEIDQLIGARNSLTAAGCRDIAILITLLGTGIRESELCNLRFEDASIDGGYLRVMGKGAKERIVPIGALGQKVLWRYVLHFRPEPINQSNNFLFLTLDGKKLQPNAIRHMLKRWGKKAGVPRLHAHLCRHTFATNFLVKECGDVFRLQQILGHTTLEMVRRYVHFASNDAMIKGRVVSPVDRLELKNLKGYKVDRLLKAKRGKDLRR
jgi:site-specific recombinase XerD